MQTIADQAESTSSRLFFALWPDEAIRLALTQISQNLTAATGKPVAPHNFHATLVFLGAVDQMTATTIKDRIIDIVIPPPFQVIFDVLSYWRQPKILCLTSGVVSKPIAQLAGALEVLVKESGVITDTRPYIPHITLARQVQCLPDLEIYPIVWNADAFCLVQSCSEPKGVRYRVLERWSLI